MSEKRPEINIKDVKLRALKYFQELSPASLKKGHVGGINYDGFLAYCYTLALSDTLQAAGVIEEPLDIKW